MNANGEMGGLNRRRNGKWLMGRILRIIEWRKF